jgi:DNA-binding transcriptional LysR family regulator
MPDRLSGMEVFVRAVRTGGLSAASRELSMSPTMAAKHLDALERRLGVTLVRRTTRALSLTEAGRHFLDEAEHLLSALGEAEAEASAQSVAIAGLLRVSAPVSFGALHIAPLVPGFTRQHPALTVELGLSDRHVDLMEEGWDVAIRIGRLQDSSLIARRLVPVGAVLCAAPAYLAAHGTPRTVADLKHHNCLSFTGSHTIGTKTWSFGTNGEIAVPVHGALHSNNAEALVAAAVAGLGLVYGPHYLAAGALAEGRLTGLTLDVPLMDLGAAQAVTHPDRRPAAKIRAWINYLVKELPGRQKMF